MKTKNLSFWIQVKFKSLQANILLQRSRGKPAWDAEISFQKQDHWKNTKGRSARLRWNIMILLYIAKCHDIHLNILDYETKKKQLQIYLPDF